MKLLHSRIQYYAINFPNLCAIIHQNNSMTYAEVWDLTSALANWLSEKLEGQSRVAIFLENCPEMVYSLYAISAAGMIVVPLDPNMHEKNIMYILDDCKVQVVITSIKKINKFIRILEWVNLKHIIICESDKEILDKEYKGGVSILSLEEIIRNSQKCINIDSHLLEEKDTACILYTTGTTGPKKGVKLSHFNLLSATENINQFMRLRDGVIESLPMPLSHSFGFARLRCVFDVGGAIILENGLLRPEKVLHNIDKYKANAFSSVPTGFSILLDYYRVQFKEIGAQLRYIEIGSASMRQDHKYLLMEYCPKARICMHYGLTEASRSTFIEFHSEKAYLNTVGKPSPNVSIKIIDRKGKSLGFNILGEIAVRGNMVMQDYWNKDDVTKKTLSDGWLRTGDLGLIDQNGYVHLMGRKKEIINVGGFKVAPGEIEEVLLKFDGILEAAAVGIESQDNINYEKIKAYIVVDDQNRFNKFKELENFCLKELESYKVPEEFEIVESLPKTNSGKIRRHLLENK